MMRIERVTTVFLTTAGAVLLGAVVMLGTGNLASIGSPSPMDPIFNVSLRILYWISAGIMLAMTFPLLFGQRAEWRLMLVIWLAANYWTYRAGLSWVGCENPGALLASVAHAFGLNGRTLLGMADFAFALLLVGGLGVLLWPGRKARMAELQRLEAELVKASCPECGGHISFVGSRDGQEINCPHCDKPVILRKPGDLKMACFFCKKHIIFPSHALGTKMPCPHCAKDITLLEQKVQPA